MTDPPVVSLDVGGSSVKSALVEAGPGLRGDVHIDAIQSNASSAEIFDTLAVIVAKHLEKAVEVKGVALAFPGPFDYDRGICLIQGQEKYDALYGLDIGANLKQILGLSRLAIRYRNDAEAAILGEALYGAGKPYMRVLGLTLGTGLGSAFVAGGRVITEGADIPDQGWLYPIRYRGQRADDVFSTRGLLARLRAHGIEAADIAAAIHNAEVARESSALVQAFASFGADLGLFLKPYVSAFRADAVLITGGIAETWNRFAPSLIKTISAPAVRGNLGARAALFGAAALYF
jgi:glucokinase